MSTGASGNATTFLAYHPEIMARYPALVREWLPIVFTHKGAVHRDIIDRITGRVADGASFAQITQELMDAIHHQFLSDHKSYTDFYRYHHLPLPSSDAFGEAMQGQYTWSSSYLCDVWLDAIEPWVRWCDQHMVRLRGNVLCADHTFRSAKFIRDEHGRSIFDAFFTVMNEFGQVIGQWLTAGQSHAEVRAGLESIHDRYGEGQVCLIGHSDAI